MSKISNSSSLNESSDLVLNPNFNKSKSSLKKKEQYLSTVDYKVFQPAPVFGVDEVGRGCLAGPVYASAVCLKSDELISEFTDSKLMSEKRRDLMAPLILEHHWVGLGFATAAEIDQINILQASLLAMKRAVHNLEEKMGVAAGHLLIDGNFKIPGLKTKQTTLIKGDLRCAPISAASIVAKVTRDQLMRQMENELPGYGFGQNKGYGSVMHKKAIKELGPTAQHRKTFGGVKEFVHSGARG